MNLPESRSVVIFFLIGGLLLLVAFLLGDPTKRGEFGVDVLKNIALIVLTVVVVEVLWSLTGNEPVRKAVGDLQETLAELRQSVQLLDDSRKSDLQRVYAASGAAGSHEQWMEHLRDATHSVDLMGYTLHVWTKGANFEVDLSRFLRQTVKSQKPANGELTHGTVSTEVHEGSKSGGHSATGCGGIGRGGGARV